MRPRLLDLFCGAGGAAMGYHRAGFDVVGVDNRPQPNYPFRFVQLDALDFPLDGFDAVHASPPCQHWTRSANAHEWPDLITPLRPLLERAELPYVIENVPRAPLVAPFVLCGSAFGLRVRRHRAFETNFGVMVPPCAHDGHDFVTVAGGGPNPASFHRGLGATGGPDRKPRNVADALDALGVDWKMTRAEANEAIPPAYTEHIGGYLLAQLVEAPA